MAKSRSTSNDGSEQNLNYPLPNSSFQVNIGDIGQSLSFKSISGLSAKYKVVEYRHSNSKTFENIKMPVSQSTTDVVLRKGMFAKDAMLFNWFKEVKLNTIKRQTVTIQLLDEESKSVFVWTLKNAFPKEIIFGELDSMAATFAVEELVIAHEGLTFEAN